METVHPTPNVAVEDVPLACTPLTIHLRGQLLDRGI
jgi:hypothetical protein